jgi:hypothetical protein
VTVRDGAIGVALHRDGTLTARRRCSAALSQEHHCSAGTLDEAVLTERSVIGLVRRLDFFYRARKDPTIDAPHR